jgi:uncharacterized membrane protein YfcA
MWGHLILPVAGFFIGIVASMTGVGGGIFIVPLLTGLFGFIPQHAVGTSLMTIIFTAAAAAYSYAKQKRIFYRTGLLLTITTVPGAYAGAYLTTVVSPSLLGLIFGAFLFVMSLRMIIQGSQNDGDPGGGNPPGAVMDGERRPEHPVARILPPRTSDAELVGSRKKIALGLSLSFFAGLASGFLGIGGGVLGVPIMTLVMGVPMHYATATSMFTMIWTSLAGVAKHALAHHVHVQKAALLALGTIFGAQLGASLSRRVSGTSLRRIFGLVLFAVSLQMMVRFL